jgi:hypothetical protein
VFQEDLEGPEGTTATPPPTGTYSNGSQVVKSVLRSQDYDEQVIEVMLAARRSSTQDIYDGYLMRWVKLCNSINLDPLKGNISKGLLFFTKFV